VEATPLDNGSRRRDEDEDDDDTAAVGTGDVVSGTLLFEGSSIIGVSSIGGFVCHPVEWQRGYGADERLRGGRGSVKRQCCVRHGDSDVLSYNIGLGFIMFNRARVKAAGFFPHATSRTPAQKRPPRRPLKPASVLL